MTKTAKVKIKHISDFPNPLVIRRGEMLVIEDRPTEWPGWVWCGASDGTSGWAPEKLFLRSGKQGTALRDYEATELNVEEGEILEILSEESGWLWCRTQAGGMGWIPIEKVEIII